MSEYFKNFCPLMKEELKKRAEQIKEVLLKNGLEIYKLICEKNE